MTVIKVENLSKKYLIRHQQQERYTALRDVIANKFKSFGAKIFSPFTFHRSQSSNSPFTIHHSPFTDSKEDFWALKDVSFEIKQGDRVGIIGRNGAGKTTLLKLLSRITEPTSGRIEITGRVASLLEVGTGFHPELTGRENIFLNGAILGMSKAEIKKKFDEIVDFAEIEKFLDTPVKRYSSGMYVRLAFAVAAHLEPEILVVDEVLAVGDIQFQKKCLGKMRNVSIDEGRTLLFVSHNMSAIQQLCSRCFLLEEGTLKRDGDSLKIIDIYIRSNLNDPGREEKNFDECLDKDFQVLSVRLLNKLGEPSQNFTCDEPFSIALNCVVRKKVPGLYGYLTLKREGIVVLTSDTFDNLPNCLDSLQPGKYELAITIPQRTLAHGYYTVYLNFTSIQNISGFNVDSPQDVCSFQMDDYATERGNKREGYFSTLLDWKIKIL